MSTACRFYQSPQGCYRGSSCTFRHNGDTATSDASLSSVRPYANGSTFTPSRLRPCHFFAAGRGCRNGSRCSFAHVTEKSDSPVPPVPPVAVARITVVDDSPGVPPRGQTATEDDNSKATFGGKTPCKRKLHIQANPKPKETISDILPVLTRDLEGPFFAIDVECVATGNGINDRDVARIAVVDEDEKVVFDQYVQPTKPIVSYLTPLTGITKSNLEEAPDLHEALGWLKTILPATGVIIGQSIKKDLEWLTLQKATDYKDEFDVANLFRLPMQAPNGVVRYRYFSLRHVAKHLLGHVIQEADHDPVIDARYAMKVFKQFRHLHEHPGRRDAVLQTLLQAPRTPSFAERFPRIDGVLMRAPRQKSTLDQAH